MEWIMIEREACGRKIKVRVIQGLYTKDDMVRSEQQNVIVGLRIMIP